MKFRKTIGMLSTFFILYLRYIPLLSLIVYYVYLYMYMPSIHFYRHPSATFLGGGGGGVISGLHLSTLFAIASDTMNHH